MADETKTRDEEFPFMTFRELKAALDGVPLDMLDQTIRLFDDGGSLQPGGRILVNHRVGRAMLMGND